MNGEQGTRPLVRGYAAARDALLSGITEALLGDERCVAAWLTGSFGRGEADALSDLDLSVVVTDNAAKTMCARPWMVAGCTTDERLAMFSRFGQPAVIHENQHNAPPGGSFTVVIYGGSGLVVDWVLVPQAEARRGAESLLLFDKAGVPREPLPESLSERRRAEAVRERLAFFWMMAVVTAKYVARGDTVKVLELLDMLHQTIAEIQALNGNVAATYTRGSRAPLALTAADQIAEVRHLSERASDAAGTIPEDLRPAVPAGELELWLSLGLEQSRIDK